VATGGHGDYAGNEVDMLDLERADPTWFQLRAPSSNIQNAEYYGDGRPASRHTYYGVTMDESNDRVMLFSGSRWNTGWFTNKVDSYSLTSNDYNPAGTHPNIPSPLAEQITSSGGLPSVTLDPATGNVYLSVNGNSKYWIRSTNTWSAALSGTPPIGFYAQSALDTARNRIFVLSIQDHHVYTLGGSWSTVAINGANQSDVKASAAGMVYVAALDLFLLRKGGSGGTVYQINPGTFEATTYLTTGGGSVPSVEAGNDTFNKFLYVPRLRGAVYVPRYTGNAWFLRLH